MFDNIEAALKGNINYSESYAEFNRELYQTEIDTHFQFANNYYEVEMENENGSNSFSKIGVRIDRASNVNTGIKLSDDYKKIIFQKDVNMVLGRKFSFADNTWLVSDNSTLLTNSSSCIVRRCNNVLMYKINGSVDSEPCVIDYTSSSNQLDVKQDIILPSKNIKVYIQHNNITKNIEINNRFIFGTQVFKVIAFEDYNRLTTTNKNVGLMTIIMELDAKSENDDFVNDIAVSGLEITEEAQTLTASVTKSVSAVEKNSIVSDDVLTIQPQSLEIREGKSQKYQLFVGNTNMTNSLNYVVEGSVPASNYTIERLDGAIRITCIHKYFAEPLKLKYEYNTQEYVFKFYLRGKF